MVPLAALALAAAACAAPSPAFESPLAAFRRAFLEARARSPLAAEAAPGPRAEAPESASDLDRVGPEAARLRWEAQLRRRELSRLAARARAYRPGRKGVPPSDPSLGSDLRFFSWRVSAHARDAQRLERAVSALPAPVPPGSEEARKAALLQAELSWLESDEAWLETEARLAAWDLRRAGFGLESWDIERSASDAKSAAAAASRAARRLT